MTLSYKLVTSTPELLTFCTDILGKAPTSIYVDTEFVREKTYWSQLSLIQVAVEEEDQAYIIDVASPSLNIEPFKEILTHDNLIKVFHSARQDLEIFYHLFGIVPRPIFDTQVAAMVCGHGESIGFDTLVHRLTPYTIDKKLQYSPWLRRPLPEAYLHYAALDVIALKPVYKQLLKTLKEKKRTEWIESEISFLVDPKLYHVDIHQAYKKIKLPPNSSARFIAIVRELAAWREEKALKEDKPRSRILSDQLLLKVARCLPKTLEALHKIKELAQLLKEPEEAKDILDVLSRGNAASTKDLDIDSSPPLSASQEALYQLLKLSLKAVSNEWGISSKIIASKEDLLSLASHTLDAEKVPCLRGWRYDIFGQKVLEIIQGHSALCYHKGQLVITRVREGT